MAPGKKHIRAKALRLQKLLADSIVEFTYKGNDYKARRGEVDTETALYLGGEDGEYKFSIYLDADLVAMENNDLLTIESVEYRILNQKLSGQGALRNVHLGHKWANHG